MMRFAFQVRRLGRAMRRIAWRSFFDGEEDRRKHQQTHRDCQGSQAILRPMMRSAARRASDSDPLRIRCRACST